MKSWIMGALLIVLVPSYSWAGFIGIPTPLEREDWFPILALVDFNERQIEDYSGTRSYDLTTYSLHGEARITDQINLTGGLGFSSISTEDGKLDSDPSISYGFGAKLHLLDIEKYAISFGTGFQFHNLDNEDEKRNLEIFYREYQFFLGSTIFCFKNIRPYGGLVLSRVSGGIKNPDGSRNSISENRIPGLFVGTEVYLSPHLDLGIE